MKSLRILFILSVVLLLWSCSPRIQSAATQKADEVKSEEKVLVSTPETVKHTIPGTEVSFEMALMLGGTYMMGSPATEVGRSEDEGPQIEIQLEPFWMGVHEMSFDAFNVFREKELDKTPLEGRVDWNPDAITRPSPPYEDPTFGMGKGEFPATSMTQFAALQYCKWLSDKTGIFYRLPTEAEWEYACRTGTQNAYSFGDDPAAIDEYGWHAGNSGEKFHERGKKKPNAWGLYDMHGNVAEWTLDQYDANFFKPLAEKAGPQDNPWTKPTRLHPRTVRGGSWDDTVENHRCACRTKSSSKWQERDPQIPKSFWWNTDSPFVGFRIVSPYNQPSKDEMNAFWLRVLGD